MNNSPERPIRKARKLRADRRSGGIMGSVVVAAALCAVLMLAGVLSPAFSSVFALAESASAPDFAAHAPAHTGWPTMRSDIPEVGAEGIGSGNIPALGGAYMRKSIRTVRFVDTLSGSPADAWDVSADGDGSVLAWVQARAETDSEGNPLYDLTVAGEGGVALNANSEHLFQRYVNLQSIDFGGCVDTSGVDDMSYMFSNCESLTALDVSGFDTARVRGMSWMFYDCASLTVLDVSGFDTACVAYMAYMFYGCESLTALDVSGFDTAHVCSMAYMFYGCKGIPALDVSSFDTANVTDMSSMFYGCESLTALDVSSFDTANVARMSYMFYGCKGVPALDVSSFDTANVTDMSSMFSGCSGLTALDLSSFDTACVTDMSDMFIDCSRLVVLDLTSFDTVGVTDMSGMFSDCFSLTALDLSSFDTANVVDMRLMFSGCSGLTALDLTSFDTTNVVDMTFMFSDCVGLRTLDLTSFDTVNVVGMMGMFCRCRLLTDIAASERFVIGENARVILMFDDCPVQSVRIVDGTTDAAPSTVPLSHTGWPMMRSDVPKDAYEIARNTVPALGGEILRRYVRTVRFVGTLDGCPASAWDVSENGDGSVLAWTQMTSETDRNGNTLYDLTIAGEGGVALNENCTCLFDGYVSLQSIDFGGCVDTSGVTGMAYMFSLCRSLTSLDLSCFDTANVTDMSGMFTICRNLTALDVSSFDTANVTDMSDMFTSCRNLTALDVSSFDTANITDMSGMFADCSGLTALDLTSFDTANVVDMTFMFSANENLTSIMVSDRFVIPESTDIDGMFTSCPVGSPDGLTVVN